MQATFIFWVAFLKLALNKVEKQFVGYEKKE